MSKDDATRRADQDNTLSQRHAPEVGNDSRASHSHADQTTLGGAGWAGLAHGASASRPGATVLSIRVGSRHKENLNVFLINRLDTMTTDTTTIHSPETYLERDSSIQCSGR
jgi:hypothetical protein